MQTDSRRKLLWFAGLWLAGVVVVAGVAELKLTVRPELAVADRVALVP